MAELDAMPRFRTLVLDRGAEVLPALLGKVSYDIVLLGAVADSYESLCAAAADPDCHCIYLEKNSQITIPTGDEWTLPAGVMLAGVNASLRNEGTMRVRGWVECGLSEIRNSGSLFVEAGGSFIGGMSNTYNEGLFTVEEGGLHSIERGQEFFQVGGAYVNDGTLIFGWGGQFYLQGGTAENNGLLILEKKAQTGGMMPDGWYENKRATAERFSGVGSIETAETDVY